MTATETEAGRAVRAEAKLAAIVAHCRAMADEFNAAMPFSVRPEDIKVLGGDILAIINRTEMPPEVAPGVEEVAKLRDACQLLGRVVTGQARAMEAARIEMLRGGPDSAGRAMEWILQSLPDVDDNDPEDQWNGTETAQEWFDRTDERASGAAPAPAPAVPEIAGQMPLPGVPE